MKRSVFWLPSIVLILFCLAALAGIYNQRSYKQISFADGDLNNFKVTMASSTIFPMALLEDDDFLSFLDEISPIILKVKSTGNWTCPNGTIVQEAEAIKVIKGPAVIEGENVKLATNQFIYFSEEEVSLYFTNLMQEGTEYLVFANAKVNNPFEPEENVFRLEGTLPIFYYAYGDHSDHILSGEKVHNDDSTYYEVVNLPDLGDNIYLSSEESLLEALHTERQQVIAYFDPE